MCIRYRHSTHGERRTAHDARRTAEGARRAARGVRRTARAQHLSEGGLNLGAAGGDGDGDHAGAEVDGGQVVAHLAAIVPDVVARVADKGAGIAVPEPTIPRLGVLDFSRVPPALDLADGEQSARVPPPGGDGDGAHAGAEVDGGSDAGSAKDLRRIRTIAEAFGARNCYAPSHDLSA